MLPFFTCFFHPTKTIPAKKWLSFSGTIGLDRLRGWIPVDQLWKEGRDGYTPEVLTWFTWKISCWERSFQTWKIPSIFQVKQWFNFGFILAWAGPQTPGSSPWIPWRSFINIGKWIFYSLSGTWFWFLECARFFSLVCVMVFFTSPRPSPTQGCQYGDHATGQWTLPLPTWQWESIDVPCIVPF